MPYRSFMVNGSGALTPTHHFWPNPRRGPWVVEMEWAEINGRAECVEAHVKLAPRSVRGGRESGPRRLTTSILRGIPFGRLVEEDRASMSVLMPDAADLYQRPAGMRDETYEELRQVAEVYRQAVNSGRPTMAVAEHFTLTHSAAAKRVARGRDIGLLPPTGQGVPSAPKDRRRRGTRR
jgi:hypothetical protein